jgi:hypothetical protein
VGQGDRSLEDDELGTVLRWIEGGAPAGDLAAMPPPPAAKEGEWSLGEPDYVVELGAVDVAADGPDQFRNLIVKTEFDGDRWIKAIEIRPSSRKVVHHVILWQGGSGADQQGWLSAWAGGADPDVFPEGTGRLLKKGASLIGDMHYHPYGEAASDNTRVGLYFASDEEIKKELVNLWVMNAEFAIPPGDPNYEARASYTFAQDAHILSLAPHMHYRGKDFSYVATFPDGRSQELLRVSNYDFNWQTGYEFETPIAAPQGTRIDCVAHWDNSADNLDNPDPARTVRFGNESYDEMMIGFVDYVVDEGIRPLVPENPVKGKLSELATQHPGEIYQVLIPQQPDGPLPLTALHIPRQGEGGWYVSFRGVVGKARVYDVVWNGNAVSCKVAIPGGPNDLVGTADPETGGLALTMTDPKGSSFPLNGTRVDSAQ